MSNVEFDADLNGRSSSPVGGPGYSFQQDSGEKKGITGWLIRKGLAKDGRTATTICIVVIVANIAIMLWGWTSDTSSAPRTDVRAEDEMPGHYVNSWRPTQ